MLIDGTERFLAEAWWLRDTRFLPLKNMLTILAQEIDANPTSSMLAEYGRAYRYANSLKPEEPEMVDPLESLLKRNVFT